MRFLILSLGLLLAACSTPPTTSAPLHLMQPCPEPAVQLKTNGDLARAYIEYRRALRVCNDDKTALLEHYKEHQ